MEEGDDPDSAAGIAPPIELEPADDGLAATLATLPTSSSPRKPRAAEKTPDVALTVARRLLAAGADPAAKDKQGRTALHYAKGRGNAELVAFFQERSVWE